MWECKCESSCWGCKQVQLSMNMCGWVHLGECVLVRGFVTSIGLCVCVCVCVCDYLCVVYVFWAFTLGFYHNSSPVFVPCLCFISYFYGTVDTPFCIICNDFSFMLTFYTNHLLDWYVSKTQCTEQHCLPVISMPPCIDNGWDALHRVLFENNGRIGFHKVI